MDRNADRIPVIDMSPLVIGTDGAAIAAVAERISAACRAHGFFYVSGHGVDQLLQKRLAQESAAFFARPDAEKAAISMSRGGRAWRGWFPVGGELTSGIPDRKEGLYFGEELSEQDPLVRNGTPLHGPNLFPPDMPGLRAAVLAYIDALSGVGHLLARGIALSLGLPADYFAQRYLARPLPLFRVFHYPPQPSEESEEWGVGAHSDYGFLTILLQDEVGGLQVRSAGEWIEAPPVPGTFVCNIGDMLDRLTGGLYVSTLHRVRNLSGRSRMSYPFFFDPGYFSRIEALPGTLPSASSAGGSRWDGRDVHAFEGSYGDYLRSKIEKVFPELFRAQTL